MSQEIADFFCGSSARAFFPEFFSHLPEFLFHLLLEFRVLEKNFGFVGECFGVGVLLDELREHAGIREKVHESEVGDFDEVLAEKIG